MNMREKIAERLIQHYAEGGPWDGFMEADIVLDALMEPTEEMVGAVARITWETLLPRAGAWGGHRSIDGVPFRNAARQALVEAARAAKEGK